MPRKPVDLDALMAKHAKPRSVVTSTGRVSDRQFAETKHRYTDPRTGERVISVSSVVRSFDSGDKLGRGAAAAVRLTKMGRNYREEWDEKASDGTALHKYIENWAKGLPADVPPEHMGLADAFFDFCEKEKPEWFETERALIGQGWGGRGDLWGYLRESYWYIDGKTGRYYPAELETQCAGYCGADGLIVYDEEGNAKDLEPLPFVNRWGGLYLDRGGTWDLKEVGIPGPDDNRTPEEVKAEAVIQFKGLLAYKKWATEREKALK